MANCYECLHYEACSHVGEAGFSWLKDGEEKCDNFKNKADFAEVKHGEWIISSDGYYPFCSNCRYEPPFVGGKDIRTPYCPNCGAKMDGGKRRKKG